MELIGTIKKFIGTINNYIANKSIKAYLVWSN